MYTAVVAGKDLNLGKTVVLQAHNLKMGFLYSENGEKMYVCLGCSPE